MAQDDCMPGLDEYLRSDADGHRSRRPRRQRVDGHHPHRAAAGVGAWGKEGKAVHGDDFGGVTTKVGYARS